MPLFIRNHIIINLFLTIAIIVNHSHFSFSFLNLICQSHYQECWHSDFLLQFGQHIELTCQFFLIFKFVFHL